MESKPRRNRQPMTDDAPPSPQPSALPALQRQDQNVPVHLKRLAETARDYARGAKAAATQRAYAADWKHFCAWARRQHLEVLPPDPRVVGLYITACASGKVTGDRKPNAVSTIERRLSSLTWNFSQRGQPLDRKDRHIAIVLAGIRNSHASPPRQKEAILPEDLIAMLETLERGTLRGLRDRAMLLLGFAGGLRRCDGDKVRGKAEGDGQQLPARDRVDHRGCLRVSGDASWRASANRVQCACRNDASQG